MYIPTNTKHIFYFFNSFLACKKKNRARWRENRTIFNTPNPRLMNVSLLRESKLCHNQERRGSRMSMRMPSRQPSMASLRPHSPNPSLGKQGLYSIHTRILFRLTILFFVPSNTFLSLCYLTHPNLSSNFPPNQNFNGFFPRTFFPFLDNFIWGSIKQFVWFLLLPNFCQHFQFNFLIRFFFLL